MVVSAIHKIKHEAQPSALLASRQHAKCFILRIARSRPCFNCFKELTHEHGCLSKAYAFQVLPIRQLHHVTAQTSRLYGFTVMIYFIVYIKNLVYKNCLYAE